ncbi:ShET2/EspL2 family type III secretion system effector toxin [Candidatus Ichthyocystis sparus]|uniref:ShET2/EspL2 family type III secretion system effector toxin n=1 Tax=Candidatus Ichthyocystis sparus TaxID=1561004 RepID=UPI00159EF4E9|nr:ShET2/EspL2 family type III secretion system effector toxin [Candidatus Ichthyocystis sparus]
MDFGCSTHIHISSHTMEIVPSDEKISPYISKKNVGSLLSLNNKVEVDGKDISCEDLSLLFTLNSITCYRSRKKMKINELFSDKESVKRAALNNLKEVHEIKIERSSCGKHIIACDRFGNFLSKIASTTTPGEQRFFILHSGNHVMSFKIMHRAKEVDGVLVDKWVVHFFDPNKTNVVSRSAVLNYEEFLDLSKFSLRMFMTKDTYKDYFEDVKLGPIEDECAIYEYSDVRNASSGFSTLETMSQDGISGCMIHHMMSNEIGPMDIVRVVESSSFSTLSADIKREIFFYKSSLGTSALHVAVERNNPDAIRSYDNFLEKLSCDEQVNLLPDILKIRSSEGALALFMAMQEGHTECIDNFGLLIDRLISLRHSIGGCFTRMLFFDILLAKRVDNLSALSIAMCQNNAGAILAFANLLDKTFILKEDMISSIELSNMIFMLLDYKDKDGNAGLFYALLRGCADAVRVFGTLIDRLLVMKGHVPEGRMAKMIFRLLYNKLNVGYTNNEGYTGLFFALQKGHTDTVLAFSELIDRLLVMRRDVSDIDMADMIFRLLESKSNAGSTGLFFALKGKHVDTVIAFSGLISKFVLLKDSIPKAIFDSMMLNLLMSRISSNTPGIFELLASNDIDVIGAYTSLLVHASKEVRKEIFCVKDSNGSPALWGFLFYNNPQSMISYEHFLQALSCDEQIELLPEILVSKNNNNVPALFLAMQEGCSSFIDSYNILIENQLMMIRDRMSPDDFAGLVLNIAFAKMSDGVSALSIGMYRNRTNVVASYAGLLDRVLLLLNGVISYDRLANSIYSLISYYSPSYGESPMFVGLSRGYASSITAFGLLVDKLILMKDHISHDKLAKMIFKLLKARTIKNIDGLFMAMQEGHHSTVDAFSSLLDKFLSMKGDIEDITLAGMVFDLLMCKSGGDDIPGLFVAMQEGHHSTVDAFRKLLEKAIVFKDDISSGYFNIILLDTVVSRRSDGMSGLFAALKNNFPKVVKSYGLLLSLIPKDELVDILVASDSSGTPAALFAGKEALDSYLEIISDLPTKIIYALYSRLNSMRRSIGHMLSSNGDLDVKYKLLLEKIKELARSSRYM